MLRIREFFAVALWAVAAIMVGCESDAPTSNGGTPEVVLDRYELNVDGNGGDMAIYYGVKNPIKGATLEVKTTVDWIEAKSIENSKLVLSIAVNDMNEERQAIVTIGYQNIEKPIKVFVTQDRAVLDKFHFETSDITYKSCVVRYTPKNETAPYMANIIAMDYFSYSGVSTEEAFIEAEMNNYISVAAQYGMTLEELMDNLATPLIYTGETVRKFDGMQHGGKYVVYSYGVTFSGNSYDVTTPVHYTIVELPMPSMYDVSFKLQTAATSAGMVSLTVTPQDWEGYYNIQIAPEESLYYIPKNETPSDYDLRSIANAFYNTARSFILQGNTIDRFLNSSCYIGPQQINLQLETNKKYMIIVFAVESEDGAIPVMRSMPALAYI